jgi:hypothetical protein
MKKIKDDRSIIPFVILSILTLGIYNIWCLHHLAKDVNELCKETGNKTSGVVALLLLGILTCGLYGFFWWFRIADMLNRAARKKNIPTEVNGGAVLLCMIFSSMTLGITSLVALHQIFSATNDLATHYNTDLEKAAYYTTATEA